jgi:SAM-dependent methyltransferase
MAAEYNSRVAAAGISPDKMRAVAGDLLAADPTTQPQIAGPEFQDFDIAVVSMALHHMENPGLAVKRMVERLRPGGVVVVLDWHLEEGQGGGSGGEHGHGHGHGGGHGHGHGHGHAHSHGHAHGDDKGLPVHPGTGDASATIAHHGFTQARTEELFRAAGCDEVGYAKMDEPFLFGKGGQTREILGFIARGRKALSA